MADDDGWTQIGGSKNRKSGPPSNKNTSTPGLTRPPPSKDLTPERILADYNRKTQIWRASTCRKTLLKVLDQRCPEGGWPITKAVCMGSGSFSRDNFEHCKRSMSQFVVFMDLVRVVRDFQSAIYEDEGVEVFAQEPVYTAVDLEFLRELGVEVCKTPKGFMKPEEELVKDGPEAMELFGPATFVCELFLERSLDFVKKVLDEEVPLVAGCMATNRAVRSQGNGKFDENEMTALGETFREKYQSVRVPVFEEDPNILDGLHISTLEPQDDD